MKAIALKRKFKDYKQGDIIEFTLKRYRHPFVGGYWTEDWRAVLEDWNFSDKSDNPCCQGKDRFSLDIVQFDGMTYHWIFQEEISISNIKKSQLKQNEKSKYNKIMKDLKNKTYNYIK